MVVEPALENLNRVLGQVAAALSHWDLRGRGALLDVHQPAMPTAVGLAICATLVVVR